MKNSVLILVLMFVVSACQRSVSETKPQNANSPTVSTNVAPSVSVPDKTKIKTYDGRGTITKINRELVSVELNHEEIKNLMPAMLMEFYVSDKALLDGLKVGDTVAFVLEDNAGAERIIKIKKN